MANGILLYGANGYTGELTARLAREQGVELVLAGRNAAAVAEVARRHGMEHRAFPLDDAAALERGLDGIAAVLHCAGPFSGTSRPMVDACLRTRTHYLDVTGEVDVFEAIAARDAEALAAGVMLLPGSGFDVVPSDCLAAHLARRLPQADWLELAILGLTNVSHGTALSVLEGFGRDALVRRGGRLVGVPLGSIRRDIDYGDGRARPSVAIPWGDLSTAYRSTRIPNVTTYAAVPGHATALALRLVGRAPWLLGSGLVKRPLRAAIERRGRGPDDAARARGFGRVWGEARARGGERVAATLRTPEVYTFTALAALRLAQRATGGDAPPGFQTPASAYGPDFVLEIPGVARSDA
ncbi:MAG: saccharopine dehydrogenase NADP-binding domain-containing protein [Polyangiaceae bacterium]|nr:saccharopine dehydrogenase NADP-binding domain-containing protein [Polyangiaceae bacterium]